MGLKSSSSSPHPKFTGSFHKYKWFCIQRVMEAVDPLVVRAPPSPNTFNNAGDSTEERASLIITNHCF